MHTVMNDLEETKREAKRVTEPLPVSVLQGAARKARESLVVHRATCTKDQHPAFSVIVGGTPERTAIVIGKCNHKEADVRVQLDELTAEYQPQAVLVSFDLEHDNAPHFAIATLLPTGMLEIWVLPFNENDPDLTMPKVLTEWPEAGTPPGLVGYIWDPSLSRDERWVPGRRPTQVLPFEDDSEASVAFTDVMISDYYRIMLGLNTERVSAWAVYGKSPEPEEDKPVAVQLPISGFLTIQRAMDWTKQSGAAGAVIRLFQGLIQKPDGTTDSSKVLWLVFPYDGNPALISADINEHGQITGDPVWLQGHVPDLPALDDNRPSWTPWTELEGDAA